MRQAYSHQGSPSTAPMDLELSCIQDSCFRDLDERIGIPNRLSVLRIHGVRDETAILRAIRQLVHRHEVLRTCYPRDAETRRARLTGDEPHMEIGEALAPPSDERLIAIGRQFAARKIDIESQSGLCVGILRLDESSRALFLVLHPAITDGVSQRILTRDLVALLLGAIHGVEATLPQLPVQYGGYAAWERASLRTHDAAKNLDLMAAELARYAPWLPAAQPSAPDSTLETRIATLSVQLDDALIPDIARRAGFERISPRVLALSVFGMMATRWSGVPQLLVATPVSARQHPGLQHVIGAFTDRTFLSIRSEGVQSLRDLFWLIRAASPEPAQLARSRLDVLRAMHGADLAALPQANVVVSVEPTAAKSSAPSPEPAGVRIVATDEAVVPACDQMLSPRTPLTLSLAVESSRLLVRFDYDAAVLPLPTVETLMTEFQRLLEQAVYNPGATLF